MPGEDVLMGMLNDGQRDQRYRVPFPLKSLTAKLIKHFPVSTYVRTLHVFKTSLKCLVHCYLSQILFHLKAVSVSLSTCMYKDAA